MEDEINAAIRTTATGFLNVIAMLPVDFCNLTLECLPTEPVDPVDVDVFVEERWLSLPHQPAFEASRKADNGEDASKKEFENIKGSEGSGERWGNQDDQKEADNGDWDAGPRRDDAEDQLQKVEEVIKWTAASSARHVKIELRRDIEDKQKENTGNLNRWQRRPPSRAATSESSNCKVRKSFSLRTRLLLRPSRPH
jgi:hypothetical protein